MADQGCQLWYHSVRQADIYKSDMGVEGFISCIMDSDKVMYLLCSLTDDPETDY